MYMADEDYEILPHKLLSDLKYDVEALKTKLTSPDSKTNELILEIESLKDSIHELNVVFEKALEQTKEEDGDKTIHSLNEKLKTVVMQNETIAKGMIAISDKLEDFMASQTSPMQGQMQTQMRSPMPRVPVQHSMGMPPTEMARMAPRPEFEAPPAAMSGDDDFPPPPPRKKMRSGLFG